MSAPDVAGSAPEQEEDLVRGRAVLLVLAATVALSVGLCLWAGRLLARSEAALRPGERIDERRLGHPGRGFGIDQRLFDESEAAGGRSAAEARARLGGFGWVDRRDRRVRIPIERAMELWLEGRR